MLAVHCAVVELFLGYDPGGDGNHGVAAVRIAEDGSLEEPDTHCLRDAAEVMDWLRSLRNARALGIDTLLAWSPTGGRRGRSSGRACDGALRRKYPEHSKSVIAQNSLYSAMTINGIIVAMEAQNMGLPLAESHPKLLISAASAADPEMTALCETHQRICQRPTDQANADHEADAVVAAWSVSRHIYGKWTTDLYDIDKTRESSGDLLFPAGEAAFPWPEPIAPTL